MKSSSELHRGTHNSFAGFTLVELLAVIAIIGLLASFLFPAISRIRERARIGAVKAQLAQIELAIEQYYAEYDTYPPIGNDWLNGNFYPSEDVGADGKGPFELSGGVWIVRNDYPGPDTDGTEGNYQLDPGEDIGLDLQASTSDYGEGNNKLDGTYYDRLGMFTIEDRKALMDSYADNMYYHYYAGFVDKNSNFTNYPAGHPAGLNSYRNARVHPAFYNRWVLYGVGPDGRDHALHNYFLVMQNGDDVGSDAFASDPTDEDGNRILFEPSSGERNEADDTLSSSALTVRETGWTYTPGDGSITEADLPGPSDQFDEPDGKPVFSYDVRKERSGSGKIHATPDGDGAAYGIIMRFGP